MSAEPSLHVRLLKRARKPLAEALAKSYGAGIAPVCVDFAVHHFGKRLFPLQGDGSAEGDHLQALGEERWWTERSADFIERTVALESVRDCVLAVRARTAGPASPLFNSFLEESFSRLQAKLRERQGNMPGKKISGSPEEDAHRQLAQALLFRPKEDADQLRATLRGKVDHDEEEEAMPSMVRTRKESEGSDHHFQEALLKYAPEKRGEWFKFLETRYWLKLRDAADSIGHGPGWSPLPEDDRFKGGVLQVPDPDERPESTPDSSPPFVEEAPPASEENHEVGTPKWSFQKLREEFLNQAKVGASTDESLAIFDLTYTAYINPQAYSDATRRLLQPIVRVDKGVFGRLLSDFLEAEALFREACDRVERAVDTEQSLAADLAELRREANVRRFPSDEIAEAIRFGRKWVFSAGSGSDSMPESEKVPEEEWRRFHREAGDALEKQLDSDDRAPRNLALSPPERLALERKLFEESLHYKPVQAFKRFIGFLEIRIARALGDVRTPMLPATLDRAQRQLFLHRISLVAYRLADAEKTTEDSKGPKSNYAGYFRFSTYAEADKESHSDGDRSERFWVRSQKEIRRYLPTLSQTKTSNRMKWFRQAMPRIPGDFRRKLRDAGHGNQDGPK
jgi:hypothetical protein